jgi:two-component system nitrogen regulation sensor histidine kinase NtrY
MKPRRRLSLEARLLLAVLPLLLISILLALLLMLWLEDLQLAIPLTLVVMVPLSLIAVRWWAAPTLALFRALSGTVSSFRDADFSFSIHYEGNDELGDLVAAHNQLSQVLREERQNLFQRELLLDTVVQNTPVALVLTQERGHVVYANLAARSLFNSGRRLEGTNFNEIVDTAPAALRDALRAGGDRLFSFEDAGAEETFHLASRDFRLNGRQHTLHLFKRLTQELARQEVATWKKVIRVISHELNNSLAPISSMAHSGRELLRRGDHERLARVFAAIEERVQHLDSFIGGYASFAKLPNPRLQPVPWPSLVERIQAHCEVRLQGSLPEAPALLDASQIEQVLINLIKNAHESGSAADAVEMSVREAGSLVRIEIADRGSGMSEAVLESALLPFYSTKRSGTGLGLALAREIAEAHGGRIALGNRPGGGASVTLIVPRPPASG